MLSNKILIIIILVLLIIILYFNISFISENNQLKLDNSIKNEEIVNVKEPELNLEDNEEVQEEEEELHSDDIDNMFNLSEEKQEEEDENNTNNLVYLDINCNNNRGRIILSLNTKVTPKTAKNFSVLCEKKAYVNSPFHRVIKDFMIQGGDFTNYDGTGGISIYGNTFNDENFTLKNERGTISMANSGPNTNGSQFFISTKDNDFLDGKHVVFGKVIKGMDLIDYIETQQTDGNDRPINEILIVDTGLL